VNDSLLLIGKHDSCYILYKFLIEVVFKLFYLVYYLNIVECKNGVDKGLFKGKEKWEERVTRGF
jgi:hypothetical protein